jgi:hypothetical protein
MRTIRTLLSKINVVMPVVAGGLPPTQDLKIYAAALSLFNFLEPVHDFFHFSDSERFVASAATSHAE